MGDTPLEATSEYNCRGFGVFIRACRYRTFVQMPSKRLDDAAFANIDWDEEAGGHSVHWPTVGLLAGLVGLAAAAVHKLRVGGTPFGFIGWEPPRIAWLLLLAGLLGLRYGLYPMVRDRDRTLPALKRLFSRPVGALSAGFVVLSLLFALVGPEFISWCSRGSASRTCTPTTASANSRTATVTERGSTPWGPTATAGASFSGCSRGTSSP